MPKETDIQAQLETGLRFNIISETGASVTLDSAEYFDGQNVNFSPMEMLLACRAGWRGTSVISVLRKKRQNVTSYRLHVHGIRSDKHPKVFLEISVEHIFTGQGIAQQAVERSIELAETRYCGVSAMLGKTAKITHIYRIIESSASDNSMTS